ncbi:T3SS (YopN, CesT) and YbjN peptide-binding chaperone 1 [Ralstonia pickettii]|nr:YbjN domain-containing protein [Ralstonia pickettii]
MQDHATHLLDYLRAEGYPAERDDDGDIRFKREGMTYALCFDKDDPGFAKLILPNVWSIDSEPELQQVLAALDQVNRRIKLVKVHTQAGAVWFTVELLFDEQATWERHLSRSVRAIARAVMMFGDAMQGPRATGQAGTLLS